MGDGSAYTAGGAAPAAADDEDDDDVDLFGSDDDEDAEEKAKEVEARLKAYHEKKAKKPALIAKTSVLFDVKPWDDETDMNEMLKNCKSIEKEGLVWELPSWFQLDTVSTSFNSCALSRMKRCQLRSLVSRFASSRTLFNPAMLLLCQRS